jgi:hypothetical protein
MLLYFLNVLIANSTDNRKADKTKCIANSGRVNEVAKANSIVSKANGLNLMKYF